MIGRLCNENHSNALEAPTHLSMGVDLLIKCLQSAPKPNKDNTTESVRETDALERGDLRNTN